MRSVKLLRVVLSPAVPMAPRRFCRRTLPLVAAVFCGFGHSAGAPSGFEAAAVAKSSLAGRPAMSLLGITDSRLELQNYPLNLWIAYAYDVPEFQISGPDWIARERYDLSATFPQGAAKLDAPAMLQSLLAERFGLRIHRESRTMSRYALVVGNAGARVQPSRSAGSEPDPFTQLRSPNPGIIEFVFNNCTMPQFAKFLSKNIREAVIDATNLAGAYDVAFPFSPGDLLPTSSTTDDADDGIGQSIVDSLGRLGLKLERRRVTVETIVIDDISRPTAD